MLKLITLPVTAKDITVTVSDGTNPVSGATVTAGDNTGTTGADGKVAFEDVPETVTSISVTAEGFADKTQSVTIDASHTSFTITLTPVGTLTITVEDSEDTPSPIEGASVTIGETTKTTDETGKVEFAGMEYDDYSAEVSAEGYTTKTESIAFRSNHKSFTVSLVAS